MILEQTDVKEITMVSLLKTGVIFAINKSLVSVTDIIMNHDSGHEPW